MPDLETLSLVTILAALYHVPGVLVSEEKHWCVGPLGITANPSVTGRASKLLSSARLNNFICSVMVHWKRAAPVSWKKTQ